MSLQYIEEAIEKIAAIPNLGAIAKKTFSQGSTWKDVGKKALIGAGVGAAGNVALGDKNQSLAERAVKGGAGGAIVGGLYGAGKQMHSQAVRSASASGRSGFARNPQVHGSLGNQTPEQRARLRTDMQTHMNKNNIPA